MTTLAAAAALLAGCFNPQFQQGVPCSVDRECPDGQICHTDDRCYDPDQIPGDAGVDPSAALSALEVSLGELVPPFDPQTTQYTLDLGLGATELVVTPTAADATATIDVTGSPVESGSPSAPVALNLGDNTVTIEVDAGNGVTATYEIAVDRGGAILQSAYVKASNTGSGDHFGGHEATNQGNGGIAISGDTLAIAAPLEDSAAVGIDGNEADNSAAEAGAVYIFVRRAGGWEQQAYVKPSNAEAVDLFGGSIGFGSGLSLSLSGDTLAVGAPLEDSTATGVNGDENADAPNSNSGAVYVFVRDNEIWSQQAYLKASNTDSFDHFGASVALDGDTLAVGALGESSSSAGVNGNETNDDASQSGAVYVFRRLNNQWSQEAYIKASNPDATDRFGTTVAVFGDTLAVGSIGESSDSVGVNSPQGDNSADDAGAVYVFHRVGATWSQQAYVKPSNTDAGDRFGSSIALSQDLLVVGAPSEGSPAIGIDGDQMNNAAPNAGAAYLFRRNGAVWSQDAYLKASNTSMEDSFGITVAISEGGDGIAIAASGEDSSIAGVGGNELDNAASTAGAVYLFTRNGSSWSQAAYIKASNPEGGDRFGAGLAFSGTVLAVGAPGEDSAALGIGGLQSDNSASDAGAVYIFE